MNFKIIGLVVNQHINDAKNEGKRMSPLNIYNLLYLYVNLVYFTNKRLTGNTLS